MIIAAVDPGKVTGLAVWCDGCDSIWHVEDTPPETAEVAVASTVGAVLLRMLADHGGENARMIAIERFVQGSRKTRQPDALEVTGLVGGIAAQLGIKVVYQSPGPAVKIASNQRLRELGWYVPSKDQHANAAQRHILLAIASFFPDTFAKLTGV